MISTPLVSGEPGQVQVRRIQGGVDPKMPVDHLTHMGCRSGLRQDHGSQEGDEAPLLPVHRQVLAAAEHQLVPPNGACQGKFAPYGADGA